MSAWTPFAAGDLAFAPYDQLCDFASLLALDRWPTLDALTEALHGLRHPSSDVALAFVEQNQRLVADNRGFEARIAASGAIAMRPENWHDLLGALMWLRYPQLKLAINALQVADLPIQGTGNRTRRQQGLTHVDEAGVLVASDDITLLDAIDAHAWERLFCDRAGDYDTRWTVHVFGHALFELYRERGHLLAAKALLFEVPAGFIARPFAARAAALDAAAAAAVLGGALAADPQAMPSLPLAAMPGWIGADSTRDFVKSAPCFRPRPPGRVYAPPVVMATSG